MCGFDCCGSIWRFLGWCCWKCSRRGRAADRPYPPPKSIAGKPLAILESDRGSKGIILSSARGLRQRVSRHPLAWFLPTMSNAENKRTACLEKRQPSSVAPPAFPRYHQCVEQVLLPKDFLRAAGVGEEESVAYERAFPEGVAAGPAFVAFCSSSGIDVDTLARKVLSGRELRRYSSAYATARAHFFGIISRERPLPDRKKELLDGFKRDCAVAFVGSLRRRGQP